MFVSGEMGVTLIPALAHQPLLAPCYPTASLNRNPIPNPTDPKRPTIFNPKP